MGYLSGPDPLTPAPTLAEQVSAMSRAELERASAKFGPLNSTHEGWAVILEEIDEASEEINALHTAHSALWRDVRDDDGGFAAAEAIVNAAERGVVELIQVAAMGRRYIRDLYLTPRDEPGPRTDASGPDMWPDDQPTSADVPEHSAPEDVPADEAHHWTGAGYQPGRTLRDQDRERALRWAREDQAAGDPPAF